MQVIINPGSGPVINATLENAELNMIQFIKDSMPGLTFEKARSGDQGGRFSFDVKREGYPDIEVDMPGLPLEKVRYISGQGQNIWDFPRLYVNGSSWIWQYALINESWYEQDA